MTKFAPTWSLASIAAMMLGATAMPGSAVAQTATGVSPTTAQSAAFGRGGFGEGGDPGHKTIDPGPRGGAAGAGGPHPGLSQDELNFFTAATDVFNEVETVAQGLGPRFNLDSCGGVPRTAGRGRLKPSDQSTSGCGDDGGRQEHRAVIHYGERSRA